MNTRHAVIDSPLGELTLVADGDALDRRLLPASLAPAAGGHLRPTRRRGVRPPVRRGAHPTDRLPRRRPHGLRPADHARGDEPQQRVWNLLTAIPYGDTVTYGELAAALADGTTAQEVGQAVGRNPLSIVVPCHRVVGSNGQLTGYAGGLKRKQFLLELEEPADVKAARLF